VLGELSVGRCEARAVALEVGVGQAAAVAELVRRAGYGTVDVRRDLAGIERVVLGVDT
jgi:methylase of polypeptide subunit release factors